MDKVRFKEKLLSIYNDIISREEIVYEDSLNDFDFFNIMTIAGKKECLYNFGKNNFCIFNYNYENYESVLMLFGIPINNEKDDILIRKSSAQQIKDTNVRIIEIASLLEETFITLDYIYSIEKDEDKFIYLLVIKKIKNDE